MKTGFMLKSGIDVDALKYDYILCYANDLNNSERIAWLFQLKKMGKKILLHIPICYENETYTDAPQKNVIKVINDNRLWLCNEKGERLPQDTNWKLFDVRNMPVVRKIADIWAIYLKKREVNMAYLLDGFFLDFAVLNVFFKGLEIKSFSRY